MGIKCYFKGHNYDECTCTKCGAVRDEHHAWNGCTCTKCETVRDEQHNWNACICKICGKVRDEQHDMEGDFCKTCGFGTYKDARDGKVYRTVKIGDQVWMAENLAYKTDIGKCWAYEKDENNVAKYGYLYNYEAAENACPSGWRLPEIGEFEILLNRFGGQGKEAFQQLIVGGSSSFSVLFGGFRDVKNGVFHNLANLAIFWSSTKIKNMNGMWIIQIAKSTKKVYLVNYRGGRGEGYSIRCIKK